MEHSGYKWFLALALITLGGSPVVAQSPGQSGAEFYFSDGARIALEASPDWVAVRLTSAGEKSLGAAFPSSVDFDQRSDLVQNRLSLVPIREPLSVESRQSLYSELSAMPEVELVAPVYRAPGALMIVTDQFIASFADGISESEVDAINRRHGVQTIKRLSLIHI